MRWLTLCGVLAIGIVLGVVAQREFFSSVVTEVHCSVSL